MDLHHPIRVILMLPPRILVVICALGPALSMAAGEETRSTACGLVGKGAWVRLLLEEQELAGLELTEAQASKLASLARELGEEEPGCDFSEADCRKRHKQYWSETIPSIAERAKKVLGDEKTHRLKAHYWSRVGPLTIPCDPELVAYLRLTESQVKLLIAIQEKFQKEAEAYFKAVPENDYSAMDDAARSFEPTRAAYKRRCLDVLRPDQRDRYDALASPKPRAGEPNGAK